MDDRGPLHAWRDGMARFADGLPLPGRPRARRIDPTLAVSSTCRHEWLPSPIGPAEYCGRCGAMRRRQANGPVVDTAAATPTIVAGVVAGASASTARQVGPPAPSAARQVGPGGSPAPRPVGPVSWPTSDDLTPAAAAPAAAFASTSSVVGGSGLDEPQPERPAATARLVTPRITRPEPLGMPIAVATSGQPSGEHQRSFIRTAMIGAVLLSFGVLVGFIGADVTRDAREGRGGVAVAPTTTPGRPTIRPSAGPSGGIEASPAPSPAASPSAVPGPTIVPAIGPAMAPPVVALGNRLTSSGIELDLAWQAPAGGERVSRYDLRASRDGGAEATVDLAKKTSRSATMGAAADHGYAFRLRARAADGTPGEYAESAVRLSRIEESAPEVRASKGWKVAKHPDYTGAGARYATAEGAELSLAFDGTGAAIVGPKGPGRGRAEVFVDGERVGRFDAAADRFRPVQLLFSVDGLAPGPHVLTVRVAGTSGRPMVAVDRFLVLSQP